MKKIIITGSNGFVGNHVIDLLASSDYQIIGLIQGEKPTKNSNVIFKQVDILDKNALEQTITEHQPDYILHLAGIAKTWDNNLEDLIKVNFYGTFNLYEAITKQKKISGYDPKIVYISSAEVYGKTNNPEKIDETSILNPINDYGISKTAADRLSYKFSQSEGLKICIIRPFPHAGPRQNTGFFIPDMATQIVALEKNNDISELLVGNLSGIRDYTDVRDVAQAYKLVLESDFIPGEVFNLCSGKGIKIEEVLQTMLKLAKKPINIKTDLKRLRPLDLPVTVGDNTKIKTKINWQPQIPFEQTLQDVLEYWRHKSN